MFEELQPLLAKRSLTITVAALNEREVLGKFCLHSHMVSA